ncbi:hypothetical protein [Erwinia sp.]|uniref:hypothetical protein n=1 Tax=Erwinia citreus TaxID=558 RepID=UPI003C77E410
MVKISTPILPKAWFVLSVAQSLDAGLWLLPVGAALIGIGGGFTALIGMVGGAAIGAVLGAISGPFVGYKPGLVIVEGMLNNLMIGKPGV